MWLNDIFVIQASACNYFHNFCFVFIKCSRCIIICYISYIYVQYLCYVEAKTCITILSLMFTLLCLYKNILAHCMQSKVFYHYCMLLQLYNKSSNRQNFSLHVITFKVQGFFESRSYHPDSSINSFKLLASPDIKKLNNSCETYHKPKQSIVIKQLANMQNIFKFPPV